MTRHALCTLALLLTFLALASPALAGTQTIDFPAVSVQQDDEHVSLDPAVAPGAVNPVVRIHAPSQPKGCPGPAADPGATIASWLSAEGTTVQGVFGGSWAPYEVGIYEFCIYEPDGSVAVVDRQVVHPLSYTLAVTPGPAGAPATVTLTGLLAITLVQRMGFEFRYHEAGGPPCAEAPSIDDGTAVAPPPLQAPAPSARFWLVDPQDSNPVVAIQAQTAPLDPGSYVLCMWESNSVGVEQPDLTLIAFGDSTTFVVPPAASVSATVPTAPSVVTARAVLRSVTGPSLTGRFRVGSLVRCGTGRWSATPKISAYRWYRGTRQIARASVASYRVTRLDAGRSLHCQVVASSAGGHTASRPSASHTVARATG
jgi:hypothetical protein